MKKYSSKMVMDYLQGNDIDGIAIEELEDDFEFMQKVINYSNDKNMFNLCSTRLQKDFEFIKFIISKFRNDLDFIEKLSKEYLKEADETSKTELAIIMCNITGSKNKERFVKYYMIANIAFLKVQQLVEVCKNNNPNEPFGLGFIFLESDEENSDIMLEYFAKRLIDSIPPIQNNELEQIIHQRYQRPEEFPRERINSFLIDFISAYDISLANFIKLHINILDSLKTEMYRILTNWNKFNQKQEWYTYQLLFERVHQYMKENCEIEFLEDDLLYFVGKELGIIEKIKKYDYMNSEDIDAILAEISFDKESMDFEKFRHYSVIKKIIQDTLKGENSFEEEDPITKKAKIIEMKFRKKDEVDHA